MLLNRFRFPIRLALIVYWLALFISTHTPKMPSVASGVDDKLLHYLAYGGLGFLLAADFGVRGRFSVRYGVYLLIGIICYAAIDELLQIPVGRTADVQDWVADALGAICGLAAFAAIFAVTKKFHSWDEQTHDNP